MGTSFYDVIEWSGDIRETDRKQLRQWAEEQDPVGGIIYSIVPVKAKGETLYARFESGIPFWKEGTDLTQIIVSEKEDLTEEEYLDLYYRYVEMDEGLEGLYEGLDLPLVVYGRLAGLYRLV